MTETVVHHLDMTVELHRAPAPHPEAMVVATRTLDGLLATPRPERWSIEEYLLKATGRIGLSNSDNELLGPAAKRFPLLS